MALRAESEKVFGVVAGDLLSRLVYDMAKKVHAGEPCEDLRLRVADLLLKDMARREDLGQRERRLRLEEDRAKPGPDWSGLLSDWPSPAAPAPPRAAPWAGEVSQAEEGQEVATQAKPGALPGPLATGPDPTTSGGSS